MNRAGVGYWSSRGRSPRSVGRSSNRRGSIGANGSLSDASLRHEGGLSHTGRQNPEMTSVSASRGNNSSFPGVGNISSGVENLKLGQNSTAVKDGGQQYAESTSAIGVRRDPLLSPQPNLEERRTQQEQLQDATKESCSSPQFGDASVADASWIKKSPQIVVSGFKGGFLSQENQSRMSATDSIGHEGRSDDLDSLQKGSSFDICMEKTGNIVKLKPSLHVKNREKRNEMKRHMEGENIKMLSPGMVLLKGYLSLADQVKLIKKCRDLGRGSGGFYQPAYQDGAKLHLKMMCLGKNWDPETSSYSDERPSDGAKPPPIPAEFQQLVKGAIQDSHAYLESTTKVTKVKDILPSMSPNICIVNFYSKSGRLGLHQDKDESEESLRDGLPVVSFSIGDSAEFLYGEHKDIDKAKKVVLESGDVLIFGGKSRLIFHGVTSIIPDTAHKALLDETDLRPGRLNLTFREY